jgi:hypothetical protein
MYNGFRVLGEVVLSEMHVTLRARRFDDVSGHSWDDLYRGVFAVDGSLEPVDQIFLALTHLLADVAFLCPEHEKGAQGSHRLDALPATG